MIYENIEINLVDYGVMDTVVRVNGEYHFIDCEYARSYRLEDGTLTDAGLLNMVLDLGILDYIDNGGNI